MTHDATLHSDAKPATPAYSPAIRLTRAMVTTGSRLDWGDQPIADKHCIGGLPGNRTTPIVVAIAAACGLTIPKTSSRAITSPAGTADTMETLTQVDLDVAAMRRVVEAGGGCLVWGGAVDLSREERRTGHGPACADHDDRWRATGWPRHRPGA